MNKKLVPEIRFKGYEDEWKDKFLKEACYDFKYGLNAPATEYDGKNKYLRITDIDDTSRKFIKRNLTSPLVTNLSDGYKLEENDIVFARTGASVGKTYIFDSNDGKVYWAGFLIRGKVQDNFDSNFIFQNTLTDNYYKFIEITSQRSGQPGVNAKEYGEYQFFVPILEEQKKIGEYFKKLDGLIADTEKKIERLDKLKTASLQKMFPQPGESAPQIYMARDKNDRIHRFANALGVDENQLRSIIELHLPVDTLNQGGHYKTLQSTIDFNKAKEFIEKLKGCVVPPFEVNRIANNLLRKFINEGGFEIDDIEI